MHFKTGQHYITYTVTMDAIDMEWSGWKQTKNLCVRLIQNHSNVQSPLIFPYFLCLYTALEFSKVTHYSALSFYLTIFSYSNISKVTIFPI